MVDFSEKPALFKADSIQNRPPSDCVGASLDKRRLEEILENIPSAVLVFEKPTGKVIFANKRANEIYGFNPCGITLEEHIEALKIKFTNGKHFEVTDLYTYKALSQGETVRNAPSILERADGSRITVNVSSKPLYGQNGEITGAVTIFDDITENNKMENALKESEERLKMAQQIAHVGSWEYYVEEDKAIWSEELFRIFGLEVKQYGPSTVEYAERVHPDDREALNKIMETMLFNPHLFPHASFDYRIINHNGAVRTIHSERMVREFDQDNKPLRIAGIEQDITERKQNEKKLEQYAKNLEELIEERTKQLQNAERLATIGQTAGMIGHDIRNPLQAIAGELYLINQDVAHSPDSNCKRSLQESLESIQEQIDYINKIVSDLQDFARPLTPEKRDVDLRTLIPQLLSTVYIPVNVEAHMECQPNLPKIQLDVTFLKRVLVNLVTNALQAMPDGGELTVKVAQEGNDVAITVVDTGIGIPDDVKPKIFQPLMTTKSKGQGFGLAVVKRLVETQGGSISFESKMGEGSKFKVTFPKAG